MAKNQLQDIERKKNLYKGISKADIVTTDSMVTQLPVSDLERKENVTNQSQKKKWLIHHVSQEKSQIPIDCH